jgi:hypothetical protein
MLDALLALLGGFLEMVICDLPNLLRDAAGFAASCWGPVSDPYTEVWRELLDSTVGDEAVQHAIETVVPWEGHFSSPDNVRTAFLEAAFGGVHAEVFNLPSDHSVQEYIADRAFGAAGSFARRTLGDVGWREFLAPAEAELRWRFGDRVRHDRPVVLGAGTIA